MNIETYIRDVNDFPKAGIVFKDIVPLLADPKASTYVTQELAIQWQSASYDVIPAFDARGFLFGAPLSQYSQKPLVMMRKAGKLPGQVEGISYGLEYANSELEVQSDMIKPGQRVLFIDDVLATGGTTKAGIDIVERLGGSVVGCGYVLELDGLGGRDVLNGYKVQSLVRYD